MLNYLSKKIFGSANERTLKKILPIVEKVNALEKKFEKFSDDEIIKKNKRVKK